MSILVQMYRQAVKPGTVITWRVSNHNIEVFSLKSYRQQIEVLQKCNETVQFLLELLKSSVCLVVIYRQEWDRNEIGDLWSSSGSKDLRFFIHLYTEWPIRSRLSPWSFVQHIHRMRKNGYKLNTRQCQGKQHRWFSQTSYTFRRFRSLGQCPNSPNILWKHKHYNTKQTFTKDSKIFWKHNHEIA